MPVKLLFGLLLTLLGVSSAPISMPVYIYDFQAANSAGIDTGTVWMEGYPAVSLVLINTGSAVSGNVTVSVVDVAGTTHNLIQTTVANSSNKIISWAPDTNQGNVGAWTSVSGLTSSGINFPVPTYIRVVVVSTLNAQIRLAIIAGT